MISSAASALSTPATSRPVMQIEVVAGFVMLPLAVGTVVPPVLMLPTLWVAAAAAIWRQQRELGVRFEGFWAAIAWREAWPEVRRMLLRFAVAAVLLTAAVLVLAPERWLRLPREEPRLWAAIMVLYPVLSVYPQEALYRRFFFFRGRSLGLSERQLRWASALVFGAMHLIFRNPVAVGLTVIGGWFFADTYQRRGSLRLVCLEHALYGNLLFTIGLGDFFFRGLR